MVALGVAVVVSLVACGSIQEPPPGSRERPSSDIAFSFGGSLYALAPDGSTRVRLTRPVAGLSGMGRDSDPAWSPDARRIAFVRRTDTEWALVVAEVESRAEQVLLREPNDPNDPDSHVSFDAPGWSPDGARIAYTRWTLDRKSTFRPRLYVIDAKGGSARPLARDAADAAWSPDGRQIAFASVRDRNGKRCWDQCQLLAELYVMNADGTGLKRLTRNRGDDHAPSWSPDGRRIAFASDRNYPDTFNHELYSIRPNGSCLTWLTNGTPASDYP